MRSGYVEMINAGYMRRVPEAVMVMLEKIKLMSSYSAMHRLLEYHRDYQDCVAIMVPLARFNNTNKALKLLYRCLELEPLKYDVYSALADLCLHHNMYDLGTEAIRYFIKLKPNVSNAWNTLGRLLFRKKQLDDSIEAYTISINLGTNIWEPYNNRALAYTDLKMFDNALNDYEKCIEYESCKLVRVYANRGYWFGVMLIFRWCYYKMHEYELALKDLDYCAEMATDRDSCSIRRDRGIVCQALKMWGRAQADFEYVKRTL